MSLGGQLSKAQVYKKLTSVEGGNYSPSDAQYGVDQVQEIVWKQNALAKAIKYYQEYGYSDEEIIATLTSSDGGRFTMEEAEYAAENKY
ncbi:Host cell surface-exposed lipoprotein [Apilactobacillus kunkeei]|uniref:Host cell surface-exposed lipoprotein n=1 Tax=Apilactobacillus kunkeei TaxID=148814 RepID=A0A0P7J6L5_9LACO|nr:Host cell surface-exposed lipoprotein [Apilactobacillus kunkeei]